jgi:hypothetical protein
MEQPWGVFNKRGASGLHTFTLGLGSAGSPRPARGQSWATSSPGVGPARAKSPCGGTQHPGLEKLASTGKRVSMSGGAGSAVGPHVGEQEVH